MTARIHFSPANQLRDEAKALCEESLDTFAFPRWYVDGSALFLESSSGSRLMTVRFADGTVTFPDWAVERCGVPAVQPMPASWAALYAGSLFNADGSAVDHAAFEAASAAWARGARARVY